MEEGGVTKRKRGYFPLALSALQVLQIALLELQKVQDLFPFAKTEEKEPTCHISKNWRLAEGSHRQALANKHSQDYQLPPGGVQVPPGGQ